MMVGATAEWATSSGSRQGKTETLDDNDGKALLGEERWEALSWVEKHNFLEQRADLLILAYLFKEEVISKEYFEQRVAQVKAR
jgi:hypothetical protein